MTYNFFLSELTTLTKTYRTKHSLNYALSQKDSQISSHNLAHNRGAKASLQYVLKELLHYYCSAIAPTTQCSKN